jgi:hypothetical protein
MIRGLQITLRGEELSRRIAERVRVHEAAVAALDERIARRAGDASFDVRPEDDFKTRGELESERQHYRDRITELMLLRDNLTAGEVYALSHADLRLAELISSDSPGAPEISELRSVDESNAVVDGLKLRISGAELRKLLDERIRNHQRRAEWWEREQARTPAEQTEDEPLLPDQMCENEAERHDWRARVLAFIHDHVDSADVYRLGAADLDFGELLPEKPGWLEQEEFEERNRVGFQLERVAKRVGALLPRRLPIALSEDEDVESFRDARSRNRLTHGVDK